MNNYPQHPRRAITRSEPMPASKHMLHFIMTLFTGGLWIPVWVQAARIYRREHTVTEYQ